MTLSVCPIFGGGGGEEGKNRPWPENWTILAVIGFPSKKIIVFLSTYLLEKHDKMELLFMLFFFLDARKYPPTLSRLDFQDDWNTIFIHIIISII